MAVIRCKGCGRLYDYQKQDMCPKCGAYNRPPRRERVEADGTVHEIGTPTGAVPAHGGAKVCYEEKTCYEQQTRVSRRGGGVQRLTEQLQTMGKKKRDALIGVAVTVLILLIPVLKSCAQPSYVINYDFPQPVAPAEEVLPEYFFYQPMRTFEVLGKTARLTEIFITQDEVSLTIEGLAADAPEPYLCIYTDDGTCIRSHPTSIMEWGDGEAYYTYDRAAFDESNGIAGWALQFETPDGMTEVDLTGYFDF